MIAVDLVLPVDQQSRSKGKRWSVQEEGQCGQQVGVRGGVRHRAFLGLDVVEIWQPLQLSDALMESMMLRRGGPRQLALDLLLGDGTKATDALGRARKVELQGLFAGMAQPGCAGIDSACRKAVPVTPAVHEQGINSSGGRLRLLGGLRGNG